MYIIQVKNEDFPKWMDIRSEELPNGVTPFDLLTGDKDFAIAVRRFIAARNKNNKYRIKNIS